jgi:hypothetical protein
MRGLEGETKDSDTEVEGGRAMERSGNDLWRRVLLLGRWVGDLPYIQIQETLITLGLLNLDSNSETSRLPALGPGPSLHRVSSTT